MEPRTIALFNFTVSGTMPIKSFYSIQQNVSQLYFMLPVYEVKVRRKVAHIQTGRFKMTTFFFTFKLSHIFPLRLTCKIK